MKLLLPADPPRRFGPKSRLRLRRSAPLLPQAVEAVNRAEVQPCRLLQRCVTRQAAGPG